MPSSCCAYGCTNYYAKADSKHRKVSYYTFPLTKPFLLKQWLAAIQRLDFYPNQHTRICSDHFSPDCFMFHSYSKRRLLKEDSVPTIFNFSRPTNTARKRAYLIGGENDEGRKLIEEMQAKGLTIEGIQVAGSSSSEQEIVLPDVDMQAGTSSSTGIFIKQEITETEGEEIPNFLCSEFATTSTGIISHENPINVPTTSAAFHSQETLSTHMSSQTKSDHQKSTDQQAKSASSAEGPVDESEKLISNSNITRTSTTKKAGVCSIVSYNLLRDEFDVFGDLIAVELRNMDAHMRNIVQKLVTDIIHEVKLGKRLTDDEKTNFALKRDDFIKRISSLDKSNPVNLSDVEDKGETVPDIPMADFISDTSPSTIAPDKRKDTVSVPIAVSTTQELVPNILSSSEDVAKSDQQKSTMQLSQPIERIASTHTTLNIENERSKLKSKRLDTAEEPTCVSKVARIDKSSDSFAFIRTKRNQNDIFGEFVVIELKKMDAITNSIVQKIITELIFEAKVGVCLTSEEKNILGLKSYIFINRLHSADKNLNNELNCSADKTNENLTPT